jgi:hypothetical protein
MPATPDLTEADLFTAIRALWLDLLPSGVEVIRAQTNRVAEPAGPDFVILNTSLRQRIETTTETWDPTASAPTALTAFDPAMATMQCDVHGPNGADAAWSFCTLWRSSYACNFLAAWCATNAKPSIQPLYANDPRQIPFINGEQAYEDRWVVEALFQANVTISFAQQFADTLAVGLVSVDATYHP